MVQRKVAAAALAVSVVLFGASACGSSDDASDKASEKLAEELTGGDVDIDSEDGSVKLTDEDGNTTEYGSGAELPDGWPADLTPPDDVTIVASSTRTDNGVETLFITGESETAMDELFDEIKGQITDAGYEITNESNMSSDTGGFASLEGTSDANTVSVTLSEDTETGKSTVLYNITANS